MLLCDTHADTLSALVSHGDRERDVTMDRLKAGGVSLQTLAYFIGGSPKTEDIAAHFSDMDRALGSLLQQGWRQIDDPRDAVEGENAFMLSVEGCDLMKDDPDLPCKWRKKGMRIAALVWNYENAVGTPACVSRETPLKPLGRAAAEQFRQLGIAVDISHLNDRGVYDLLEMGIVPIATHSCCRALCSHVRNLSDDQLKALFETGGYVGVNFYPVFLREDKKADLDSVVDHILHMLELGGEGMIGFGSDFDGIECKPAGLEHPGCFPALLDRMEKRGIGKETIRGIAGKNLLCYFDRIDPRT